MNDQHILIKLLFICLTFTFVVDGNSQIVRPTKVKQHMTLSGKVNGMEERIEDLKTLSERVVERSTFSIDARKQLRYLCDQQGICYAKQESNAGLMTMLIKDLVKVLPYFNQQNELDIVIEDCRKDREYVELGIALVYDITEWGQIDYDYNGIPVPKELLNNYRGDINNLCASALSNRGESYNMSRQR